MSERKAKETEEEIAARVAAEWELVRRNAGTRGSSPVFTYEESESEKSARTPGSENTVLKKLKKEHPDWRELQ